MQLAKHLRKVSVSETSGLSLACFLSRFAMRARKGIFRPQLDFSKASADYRGKGDCTELPAEVSPAAA